MSIYGISNSTISRPATPLPLRDSGRAQTQQPGAAALPTATRFIAPTQAPAKSGAQALSAEAPAGTDPALWSVLSSDERAFFAKAGAMGPLTYGRALRETQNAQMPASRGGRLDVKI